MSIERLWAPWRLAYIKGDETSVEERQKGLKLLPGGDRACFLCCDVVDTEDRENLVVERSAHSVVVLNRFPYNNGHLLVAPQRHVARLADLTSEEQLDGLATLNRYLERLEKLMRPEGFNVGLNLGRVAGAGLPGHVHWHIVPRWNGDTNFMPVLANVKIIPQSLDSLWELLQPEK